MGRGWIKKKERGKKKKGKTAPFKIKRRREQKGGGVKIVSTNYQAQGQTINLQVN